MTDAGGNRPVWERRYENGLVEYTDSCTGRYAGQANCYSYAFKMSTDPRTGKAFTEKPQPGEFDGRLYSQIMYSTASAQGGEISPDQIKNAIISGVQADGVVLGFSIREVDSADYPTETGQWIVALAFDYSNPDSRKWDYHWWRRMPNGTWEHKPASTPIRTVDSSGNTIRDPGTCDRGCYCAFFGFYVVTPSE